MPGVQRIVLFIAVTLLLPSCHHSPLADAVIVRVYRDRNSDFSRELDHKLYNFTNQLHRISSGKRILVATVEPFDYKKELGGKVAIIKPQIVILDAPGDANLIEGINFDLQRAKSVCESDRDCPAFIPAWVSGEELEAARKLLEAIT